MDNLFLEKEKEKMDGAIKAFETALVKVRTGRANPTMLDGIRVDYYGSPTPLNQIASISIQEGKTLVIKPFDRNSVKDAERAINTSDLGLPVQNNGDVLRITVPALTEETRKGFCKDVDKMAEEAKVQVRNVRREQSRKFFIRHLLQHTIGAHIEIIAGLNIRDVNDVGAHTVFLTRLHGTGNDVLLWEGSHLFV